jgi:hypothetical protein
MSACIAPARLEAPEAIGEGTRIYVTFSAEGAPVAQVPGDATLSLSGRTVWALDYPEPHWDLGIPRGEVELFHRVDCGEGCQPLPSPAKIWRREIDDERWSALEAPAPELADLHVRSPCAIALPKLHPLDVEFPVPTQRLYGGINGLVAMPGGVLSVGSMGVLDRIFVESDTQATRTRIGSLPRIPPFDQTALTELSGDYVAGTARGQLWRADGDLVFREVTADASVLGPKESWRTEGSTTASGLDLLALPGDRVFGVFGYSSRNERMRRRAAMFENGAWRILPEPDVCEAGGVIHSEQIGPRLIAVDGGVLVPNVCPGAVLRWDVEGLNAVPVVEIKLGEEAFITSLRTLQNGEVMMGVSYTGLANVTGAMWRRDASGHWSEEPKSIPGGVYGIFELAGTLFVYYRTAASGGSLHGLTPHFACETNETFTAIEAGYITVSEGRVFVRKARTGRDQSHGVLVISADARASSLP